MLKKYTLIAKLTLVDPMLGSSPADAVVFKERILSKDTSSTDEKQQEEAKALEAGVSEYGHSELRPMTVFPRTESGEPFIWDYQVRGFLKEAIGALIELPSYCDVKLGKIKLSKWTCKRVVDNFVFVKPRKIVLDKPVSPFTWTRPLRASTMQGDRSALATSEIVDAGASMVVTIEMLAEELLPIIRTALDYGSEKGLGQWRNSGKGRFTWEELPSA